MTTIKMYHLAVYEAFIWEHPHDEFSRAHLGYISGISGATTRNYDHELGTEVTKQIRRRKIDVVSIRNYSFDRAAGRGVWLEDAEGRKCAAKYANARWLIERDGYVTYAERMVNRFYLESKRSQQVK